MESAMARERGFTVIELVVMLAILAALMGLTVSAMGELRVRAMASVAEQELDRVQKALWAYMLTEGVEQVTPNPCVMDFASSDPPLYPQYLNRASSTVGRAYAWDAEGNVTYCQSHSTAPVGNYYGTRNFSGPVLATRTEEAINFNWRWGRPHPAVPEDNFAVRWEFTLYAAEAGLYRFQTRTDDGVRVWVNNILIIDQWHDMPATTYYGVIDLEPGVYPVRVEYYEHYGLAVAEVSWEYLGN